VFPAASYAFAVKVWLAFVRLVVLYVVEYGDDVSEVKDDPPSTLMSTLETPTLSVAFAVKLIVPDTVEPFAGEVMDITGGVVSGPPVEVKFAASLAFACTLLSASGLAVLV